MNNDFDTEFKTACNLSEKYFSHSELIELLKNGTVAEKQYAVIMLDELVDENETDILLMHLTGCDGKIREAVALKINTFLCSSKKYYNFFAKKNYAKIFADATIDINANICRLVIDSVALLKKDKTFIENYSKIILEYINQTFEKLDSFIFRDKKYVINKQLFKLYWCLESLKLFYDKIEDKNLKFILERSLKENEYTIREKVAQIVIKIHNPDYEYITKELKNDKNYYVKAVFNK